MPNLDENVGFWDSVLIENLTEESFIANLYQRYKKGLIYTYIGAFLVAINPYRPLPIYSSEDVRTYASTSFFKLPPHIYGLTNLAYQALQDQNEHQCICVLGESSAGKTETARMVAHFVSQVSKNRYVQTNKTTPENINIMRCKSLADYPKCIPNGPVPCIKKKSQGKSVEFVLTHQYKSLESIPMVTAKNDCTTDLKTSITKPTRSCINNRDSCLKESLLKNHNSSLKKKSKEHHLITCNKRTLVTSTNVQSNIGSNSTATLRDSKCDQCGHTKCFNSMNHSRDTIQPISVDEKRLCRNNSCSSDRGSRYRSHSASSATCVNRKSDNNESLSTSSFESNLLAAQSSERSIRDRIAYAQIFLEAIGNASTQRNNNSSRFGKFFDIEIDFKGEPIAAHITYYMLEKTRVTGRKCGERNFHIFYQLLSGAEIPFLKSLKLQRNAEKYVILKNSSVIDADRDNFNFTRKSLEMIGLRSDEINSIFKVIAVVLKMGNLIFIPTTNIDGTEGCEVCNEYELFEIASLLNIDVQILLNCLIKGDGWYNIDNSPDVDALCAARTRDALCRTLYGRLFTWIVYRINELLKSKYSSIHGRNFGILDFYGFENIDNNSFEQLVINYCNEKIHQNFLESTMKYQQELYIKDGLEWIKIDFFDNETICDLIDKPNYGILTLIDEPHIKTDDTLMLRIHQCCAGHPNYVTQEMAISPGTFHVRHFAGQVKYSINGFLQKNFDRLNRNISSGLYQSKLPIVQSLFPEGNPKRSARQPTSISSNIRTQLQALLFLVKNRRTHYIFCLKPNEYKKTNIFELPLIQHQIRYMNLMPLVTLWRNGHCHHISHANFLHRYKMLNSATWPHYHNGTMIEGIAVIIRGMPLPAAEFSIGTCNVFIRSPRTVFEMEEYRRCRLNDLAVLIQKKFRSYSMRKYYLSLRNSQIVIARAWRTWRECRFGIPFAGRRHLWSLYQVAREEYRLVKYRKQVAWAVGVIQRQYIQWKRRKFLLTLLMRLPSNVLSPTCCEWIVAPRFLTETSLLLSNIYHKWRCQRYRRSFDQISRNRMREKVTASIIFKDRKSSYARSVSHPFLGDYVRLRQNIQWKKMCVATNDQYVVFADIINKISRSSGKFVPILLVLSTNSMLLLDQRTLQIKYRVPAAEIYRLSLSPHPDDIAVFHVKASEQGRKKGDFVFQTAHVIEVVTKLFLVIQNATGRPPDVQIGNEFEVNFGCQTVLLTFKCAGNSDVLYNQPKVCRKGNRMEIIF